MLAEVYLAVKDHPLLAGIEHAIGREGESENCLPPRVVWVPKVGRIMKSPIRTGAGPATPRPVLAIAHEVRILLWAKSDTVRAGTADEIRAVEELARRVLVAIHDTAAGAYEPRELEWLGDGSERSQLGAAAHLVVDFMVPVTRQQPAAAIVAPMTDPTELAGTMEPPT